MGRKGKKIKSEEQEEAVNTAPSTLVAVEPPKPLPWWQITTEEEYDLNHIVATAYKKYNESLNSNTAEIKNTTSGAPITFRKQIATPLIHEEEKKELEEEEEEEEEEVSMRKKRLKNGKLY